MKRFPLWFLILGLVALLATLTSCGTVQKVDKKVFSDTEMLRFARKVLSDEEFALFKVPYKITDELREIAKEIARPGWSKSFQAKQLALKLLAGDELGITYSHNCNFSAIEVFESRKANCISYTNLFVGMARSIGINAEYAEVTEVESYSKIGDTVVYNSHVCAVVFEGPKHYLIDFSLRPHRNYHFWRAMSDPEAAAVFYNNLGAREYLEEDESVRVNKALTYFYLARKLAPKLPQVYNNLGVLELHRNNISKAESYFHMALEHRPGYFAAYSNLGSLYLTRGELDNALRLYQGAVKASPENKYAFHALARLQIRKGFNEEAERSLKKALAIDQRFTDARHDLGRLFLRSGRLADALDQFALALKYQPDDKLAQSKIDMIESLAVNHPEDPQP